MTTGRIDRAERHIQASPSRIYQAFIDRESVLNWLPPAGSRATIEKFEPHPGGPFRMKLVFEGAHATGKTEDNTDVVDGTFQELSPGKSVTQEFTFESDDPQFAGTMIMRWTLEPDKAGTRVSVAAENVPPGIRPSDHIKGIESSLANLAELVERSAR